MLAAIGDAKTCPHGHPIDAGERASRACRWPTSRRARRSRILRFENEAEDLLHYLKDAGIEPGREGDVAASDDDAGRPSTSTARTATLTALGRRDGLRASPTRRRRRAPRCPSSSCSPRTATGAEPRLAIALLAAAVLVAGCGGAEHRRLRRQRPARLAGPDARDRDRSGQSLQAAVERTRRTVEVPVDIAIRRTPLPRARPSSTSWRSAARSAPRQPSSDARPAGLDQLDGARRCASTSRAATRTARQLERGPAATDVYLVRFSCRSSTFARQVAALDALLRSWRWTTSTRRRVASTARCSPRSTSPRRRSSASQTSTKRV